MGKDNCHILAHIRPPLVALTLPSQTGGILQGKQKEYYVIIELFLINLAKTGVYKGSMIHEVYKLIGLASKRKVCIKFLSHVDRTLHINFLVLSGRKQSLLV